jgi:hypothetical protein
MRKTSTLSVRTGIIRHCLMQVTAICGFHAIAAAEIPSPEDQPRNHVETSMNKLQEITLTGKVTTEGSSEGLPGVTVVISDANGNNKQGATTNESGSFSLQICKQASDTTWNSAT